MTPWKTVDCGEQRGSHGIQHTLSHTKSISLGRGKKKLQEEVLPPPPDSPLARYQTLRKRLADTVVLLRGLDNPHDKDLHVSLQQQPSFGWQYLGLPMAQLVELMNENILVMDPGLIKPATGLNPTECWGRQRGSVSWKGALDKEFQREADIGNDSAAGSWDSPEMRIRVGIVMERRGTSVNAVRADRFENPNNNVAAHFCNSWRHSCRFKRSS